MEQGRIIRTGTRRPVSAAGVRMPRFTRVIFAEEDHESRPEN